MSFSGPVSGGGRVSGVTKLDLISDFSLFFVDFLPDRLDLFDFPLFFLNTVDSEGLSLVFWNSAFLGITYFVFFLGLSWMKALAKSVRTETVLLDGLWNLGSDVVAFYINQLD